jgi:hypothetical protein
MATNGVEFINADAFLSDTITGFITIDDMIATRSANKGQNSSNNSTYLTRTTKDITQIYGKTYGANKKETTLLCLAAARLSKSVELYEICEQDLTELPAPDLEAIAKMRNVTIIPTSQTMERIEFDKNTNYRSPTYIYNLFNKFQRKECAFCECTIPEIIAGAHIWPVADIKRAVQLSKDDKLRHATSGENGLWLCHNHHKIFDENLITITDSGKINYGKGLSNSHKSFIRKITTKDIIPPVVFTDEFAGYLNFRMKEFV